MGTDWEAIEDSLRMMSTGFPLDSFVFPEKKPRANRPSLGDEALKLAKQLELTISVSRVHVFVGVMDDYGKKRNF